jgi:site-specific DNA-methyltransferase (cytosine-N4-specific)
VWWIAKSDYPKADTSRVLRPYSKSMRALLKRKTYNAGRRPSGHQISESSFLNDYGGSIPHNYFEMEPQEIERVVRLPNAFSFSNTKSNDYYLQTCNQRGITPHPARMPEGLAAFFIQFLTDPGDIVMDPFAGSNTTGFVAECLGRKWMSIEIMNDYVEQSQIRLDDPIVKEYQSINER